ncbi:lipase-like [Bradysia coprophila]|uniref:lipase-like n=1 Tax=Bradysia coprophila TaxID=38358 RepID=UPI00187DD193|nr:lipase-like [Bradysia coprophila]
MIVFEYTLLILCIIDVFGEAYTPGSDELLLHALTPLLHPLGGLLFDGPASISNAPTTTNQNILPNLDQMMYYNYYAASTYYAYDHDDLSCEYCLKFSGDVDDHTVLNNNVHNTLALVTLSKKRQEIVVAFRGTWNVWNVVLDVLLIAATPYDTPEPILIHQGFYIAEMSLYDDVVRTIAKYLNLNPGLKVVLTGHSLGGAMARLTYFFLEDNKQFPSVVYELFTYGEPRVGNVYFAEFMNNQPIVIARVVARADIIPHIPPTSIIGTNLLGDYYVHAQTEFWIDGQQDQKFCQQNVYEDPNCSMSLGPLYNVVDHVTYFDTNLASVIGQPLVVAYLPLRLLNPVDTLPPLPKPMENLIGDTAQELVGAISPILG